MTSVPRPGSLIRWRVPLMELMRFRMFSEPSPSAAFAMPFPLSSISTSNRSLLCRRRMRTSEASECFTTLWSASFTVRKRW